MTELANYNPIESVRLPGVEIKNPRGIIVVVGPNSSGKTLLLRDIEHLLSIGKHKNLVCEGIATRRPDVFDSFIQDLIALRWISESPTEKGNYKVFLPEILSSNSKEERPHFTIEQLRDAWSKFSGGLTGSNPGWFSRIGVALVSLLSLEQRMNVSWKTNSFNHDSNIPKSLIQGLLVDSEAQEKLRAETSQVFGNAVWLDISEQNVLQLRCSGSSSLPPTGDMLNPLRAKKYPPVSEEGDGFRSYVGTCLSLLLGERPVNLIDEPELCLHPPQAHHIGRFIGTCERDGHVTFVATHSSHVLRGILETGKEVTVIRMTNERRRFRAHLVPNDELLKTVKSPRNRGETILDGVFSKGVVLVESEGDREQYQAASEAIADFPAREIHFASVWGTGGFGEPLRFFRSLRIPVAVIADLDFVCENDRIESLLDALAANEGDFSEIRKTLREVVQKVKALPPNVTEDEIQQQLREISDFPWRWEGDGDKKLLQKMRQLEERLKRLRRLKDGGLEAYKVNSDIHPQLSEVIRCLAELGLFFVPVGELENWCASLLADVSKTGKSKLERAGIAAERIRNAEDKSGDIWQFVKEVFEFLRSKKSVISLES